MEHPIRAHIGPGMEAVEKFADRIGVHWVTVYRWIRMGIVPKDLAVLRRIERVTRGEVTALNLMAWRTRARRRASKHMVPRFMRGGVEYEIVRVR